MAFWWQLIFSLTEERLMNVETWACEDLPLQLILWPNILTQLQAMICLFLKIHDFWMTLEYKKKRSNFQLLASKGHTASQIFGTEINLFLFKNQHFSFVVHSNNISVYTVHDCLFRWTFSIAHSFRDFLWKCERVILFRLISDIAIVFKCEVEQNLKCY